MNECPFKNQCQYPKSQKVIALESNSKKTVNVCQQCPLLYQINQKIIETNCLSCNTTLKEIVSNQKVGCPCCYIFISELESIIYKTQNSNTKHVGKKSQNILLHFLKGLLEKEKEENPENKHSCKKMAAIIEDLF